MKDNKLFALIGNVTNMNLAENFNKFKAIFESYVYADVRLKQSIFYKLSRYSEGFDIEERDKDGEGITLLQCAIQDERTDIIDFLIEQKADTRYAFHEAIRHPIAFFHLIKILGNKALVSAMNTKINVRDKNLTMLYMVAGPYARLEVMSALLQPEFAPAIEAAAREIYEYKNLFAANAKSSVIARTIQNYPPAIIKKLLDLCTPSTVKNSNFSSGQYSDEYAGTLAAYLPASKEKQELLAHYKAIIVVADAKIKENPLEYIQAVISLIPQDFTQICHHGYWRRVLSDAIHHYKNYTPEYIEIIDQLYLLLGRVRFSEFSSTIDDAEPLAATLKAWKAMSSYQSASARESCLMAKLLATDERPDSQNKALECAYHSVAHGNQNAWLLLNKLIYGPNVDVGVQTVSDAKEVKHAKKHFITPDLDSAYQERIIELNGDERFTPELAKADRKNAVALYVPLDSPLRASSKTTSDMCSEEIKTPLEPDKFVLR